MIRPSREVCRCARTSLGGAERASGAQGKEVSRQRKARWQLIDYSLGRLTMTKELECDLGTERVAVKR